jgi:hypothetical protein
MAITARHTILLAVLATQGLFFSASASAIPPAVPGGERWILAHYPNPERKGRPDPAVMKSLINDPSNVTLAALNDLHIFKCAGCTRLLMELREKKKQREASEHE